MKLFTPRTRSIDMTDTKLFNEHSFFKAFSNDIKAAKTSVIIESPYMTVRRSTELAPLCARLAKKGVSVRVYTRNPAHHDDNLRIQALKAKAILEAVNVEITLCNDLRHRKLAYIDNKILWEGSLNMLSHSNSREIMRRTVSPEMCNQMLGITNPSRK